MLSWISRIDQNSRVHMCISGLRRELEIADASVRATILILAQLAKNDLAQDKDALKDALDRPLDYKRDDLFPLYEELERIRGRRYEKLKIIEKTCQRLAADLPRYAIDHATIASRVMPVWMATLGAGIVPSRRDDVVIIWGLLKGSISAGLDDAVRQLYGIQEGMAKHSDDLSLGLPSFSTDDWIELCSRVPWLFTKEFATKRPRIAAVGEILRSFR